MEPYIEVYDETISHDFCKLVINYFENCKKEQYWGMVQPNVRKFERKKVKELALSPDNEVEWEILYQAQKSLLSYLQRYQKKYSAIDIPLVPTQFRIKKYDNDGTHFFDWHVDVSRISNSKRMLVAQWYLNTVEEGGETEFKVIKTVTYKVQPLQGRLLMFPPFWTYLHRGKPPISNPKYIMSTFLEMNY
ncbi:2OG-Fe(II) oxygenase [Pleurocapsa sp. PCC 7319]|uniref:2OG-Fe(II) oxygenase n=1 Tax=Pleurocapsa sp. PCC 7319 TaxID=118161 RepID=UPI00034DE2D3|nr:2OG-Fe(II) oxygenase [Pleurocapsa sp. PCC 7319]